MERQGEWGRQDWKGTALGKGGDTPVTGISVVNAESLLDRTLSKSILTYCLIVATFNGMGDTDVPT